MLPTALNCVKYFFLPDAGHAREIHRKHSWPHSSTDLVTAPWVPPTLTCAKQPGVDADRSSTQVLPTSAIREKSVDNSRCLLSTGQFYYMITISICLRALQQ